MPDASANSSHASEVARGARFEFGKNWQAFLQGLTPRRVDEARTSLQRMLNVDNLTGKSFLDAGSGSGLFSLAARQLGARVHSFDFDPQSVACTQALRERFFVGDPQWTIDEGSVLDPGYLAALGRFDVVYSWGVLHHTGALWQALENITASVAPGGQLFIAIYNRQRLWTPVHTAVKRAYVGSPRPLAWLIAAGSMSFHAVRGLIKDTALFRNPLTRYRNYDPLRGMSWWHDQLDWVGGYPFETATPDEVFNFLQARGFALERMITCGGGPGCNQFVLRRTAHD